MRLLLVEGSPSGAGFSGCAADVTRRVRGAGPGFAGAPAPSSTAAAGDLAGWRAGPELDASLLLLCRDRRAQTGACSAAVRDARALTATRKLLVRVLARPLHAFRPGLDIPL